MDFWFKKDTKDDTFALIFTKVEGGKVYLLTTKRGDCGDCNYHNGEAIIISKGDESHIRTTGAVLLNCEKEYVEIQEIGVAE